MATRSLTPGETRVIKAYVDHENHEAAAAALGISTQTLKNHLGSIYKKLDVKKAHSAVYRMAVDQGLDIFANVPAPEVAENQSDIAQTET